MEYYSAVRRKEVLPFVTTWKKLKGIMLSEINQKENKSTVWPNLYVKSKKAKYMNKKGVEWWLPGSEVSHNGKI